MYLFLKILLVDFFWIFILMCACYFYYFLSLFRNTFMFGFLFLFFFFFKRKPEYEMRISDWSSDVCSSDLRGRERRLERADGGIATDDERRHHVREHHHVPQRDERKDFPRPGGAVDRSHGFTGPSWPRRRRTARGTRRNGGRG